MGERPVGRIEAGVSWADPGATSVENAVTESEWLACGDIGGLLHAFLRAGRASGRKRRLLICACCRCVEHLLSQEGRAALAVGERYADGRATDEEAEAAGNRAIAAGEGRTHTAHATTAAGWTCWPYAAVPYYSTASAFDGGFTAPVAYALRAGTGVNDPITAYRDWVVTLREAEAAGQEISLRREDALVLDEGRHVFSLIRCIFGNPLLRIALDPSWRTPAAAALARGIYDDRRFEELPILADALEEAGCTDVALLDHCRGPGPHTRGCWPVDLLLGNE
jgi:hypothetical protein